MLETLVEEFQIGSMSTVDLARHLASDKLLGKRDRRKARDKICKLAAGLRFIQKVRADRNGSFSKLIPEELAWRKLVLLSSKDQAKWYKKHCPEVGTPEYNLFKRLCKAFGVGGNEFYYWLRKLR